MLEKDTGLYIPVFAADGSKNFKNTRVTLLEKTAGRAGTEHAMEVPAASAVAPLECEMKGGVSSRRRQ